MSSIRVLLEDEYKNWSHHLRLLLQDRSERQGICEVSDGSEDVQEAEELKPDLILPGSGLPKLDEIEAARRIQQLSLNSKIVFLSMSYSPAIVQEALSTGA